MESTSYIVSFRMVFFYLVTAVWIFEINLFEDSFKKKILVIIMFPHMVVESVCVCVFSSHSFWTSMDVAAGVTQEEGNTGFSIHLLSAVLALIFLARRIQPFLSLVDREVEFCVLTI